MLYAIYKNEKCRVLRRAKNRSRIQCGEKILVVKTAELSELEDVRVPSKQEVAIAEKEPA